MDKYEGLSSSPSLIVKNMMANMNMMAETMCIYIMYTQMKYDEDFINNAHVWDLWVLTLGLKRTALMQCTHLSIYII